MRFRCLPLCFSTLTLAVLSACQATLYSNQAITPIRNMQTINEVWSEQHRYFVGFPTPARFSVCHDLTCHSVSTISLTNAQWNRIESIFNPAANSAEEERRQIKQAIALLEKIVGLQTGTSGDLAKNELNGSRYGQLDCIDEATNTSVYLRLIEQAGLLGWHITAPRTSRGLINATAPHNTASIIDITTQSRYAVDAWFGANGEAPAIILMSNWKSGWTPEN